ncbi:group XIIA secretory phospholipase A2 isoform X2 [Echinops telfairi]|uniref:Group XIIA secretory phospholipase A2 isoform X2 n=1 Tax=Echinops telfairi TaxID=9371 RepID=A0AC55CNG8_ECHTE|nr:group XIIA secretory phospholipase A2 isoform X2 [Echinops telfairi]
MGPDAEWMVRLPRSALALVVLLLAVSLWGQEEAPSTDWRATLKTIRNGVHKIDTYLNAALDLLGGEDGLCQYKCSDGPAVDSMQTPEEGELAAPAASFSAMEGPRCFKDCAGEQNMTETDAFYRSEMFDPAEKYRMDHRKRGIALIFNHERFFWKLTLPERRGTTADRENLRRRLSDLGFEVKCFDNLKAEELYLQIHTASTSSHADADCFLCVFLSHGEGNHIYAYDTKLEIQAMIDLFKGDKCQSLVGKPKIFIIQACRGNQHDVPVSPLDEVDHQKVKPDTNVTEVDAASVYTLPAGADFLMCYSVAEGYYSHRETVNGSWYIQDLCEMLGKYGSSLEFTELLTLVNRKVSQRQVDFCKDPNSIGKKQVPCFASMLTKKLHFLPKSG